MISNETNILLVLIENFNKIKFQTKHKNKIKVYLNSNIWKETVNKTLLYMYIHCI